MGFYDVLVIFVLILVPNIKASHCRDYRRCPENEYFNKCAPEYCEGEKCPQTDLDMLLEDCPEADPYDCSRGRCMCLEGMLRNAKGKCIPAWKCPPIECSGPNEYLADYPPPPCPGESCDQAIVNPASCPRTVVHRNPTCRCIDGYFRNEEGVCVPYSECPPMDCGPGEYLNDCPPQFCAGQYCQTSASSPRSCPPTEECGTPKCMCNFNTRRNHSNGTCIPIPECPAFKCYGPNEEYKPCPPPCPGQNCTDYVNNSTCPRYRIGIVVECKPTCRCKDRFYRNEQNICVEASQCESPGCNGDPNAQKGCDVSCKRTCKLYNSTEPVHCYRDCKPNSCNCKPGYVLNEATEKCVLPEDCPKECNKPNEEYSPAFNSCLPQTCRALIDGIACTQVDRPPESGCCCKKGYYRNYLGQCISAEDCYKCRRPHEFFSCGSACDNVCKTLPTQNRTKCPIINITCNKKCYCEDGYARNKDDICVPIDQCEKEECNKPNEEYSPAFKSCPPQTCRALIDGIACTDAIRPLQSGCFCKEKFCKNYLGQCISYEDSNKCRGQNEFFSCGSACDNVCKTLPTQNRTNCPIINKTCNKKCYCEDGYARNKNDTCVPIDQCERAPECTKPNEEYVEHPPACPGESCDEANMNPARCNLTRNIQKAEGPPKSCCRCKYGYFRNKINECVEYKQCPAKECPSGENLNNCPPTSFAGQNCPTSPSSPLSCPPAKECGIPKCMCDFNMRRNRLGICIPIPQCPAYKCDGPNEEYNPCPPPCPGQNCTDYLNNATCPRYHIDIVVECKPACRCKDGFYRNEQNVCVEASQCSKKEEGCNGDPNAQKGCGNNCGNTCKHYNTTTPVPCSKICKLNGCDCKEGYVLNEETGKCILPNLCPKKEGCNGDPNAQKGCGNMCGNTCKHYNTTTPVLCSKICKLNGCDCKEGYVLNEETGKCILPNLCPKKEGCNDDPNAQIGCGVPCGNTCMLFNKGPIACKELCKVNGCDCKKGFVLNEKTGKCVLPEQCPKECNKPNEEYSPAFNSCLPQTCRAFIDGIACTQVDRTPESGCCCKKGYYRNYLGQCISAEECLKCPGKREYFSCGGACDNVCETLAKRNQTDCDIINIVCNNMCYCEKGYARNKKNECVPFDQCEPVRCSGDHESLACGVPCDNVCETLSKQNKTNCPTTTKYEKCTEMCYCDDGFARNKNKDCVPYVKCDGK